MEVNGKAVIHQETIPTSQEPADNVHLYCLACDMDGLRVPAYGYCQSCKEHLCEPCYTHHKKPTPLRHHVLQDSETMPRIQSTRKLLVQDFDVCSEHEDTLKYFCRDHGVIVCNICVTVDHRSCKVEYIPNLAKNILADEELNVLLSDLKVIQDVCACGPDFAKENKKKINLVYDNILKEMKVFRNEINACLDKMEHSITDKAEKWMNNEQESAEAVSKACGDIAREAKEIESSLTTLLGEKRINRLFIEMKKANIRLLELQTKRNQTYSEQHMVKFVRKLSILELLQTHTELGTLVPMHAEIERKSPEASSRRTLEDKTVLLEYIGEIDVKTNPWESKCDMNGIEVMWPDRLVVCDQRNDRVMCFNTKERSLTSQIRLGSKPCDLAVVQQNKIAVTAPNERNIYILSLTEKGFSTDRRLDVKNDCWGIACCQEKLIISCNFEPGKILIITLTGEVIRTFSGDLFTFPKYISVDTNGTYIYVSDCGHNRRLVYKLDWEGNVIERFKEEWHEEQQGILELDDGTFLLCLQMNNSNSKNNHIVRMSSSCKPCKVSGNEQFSHLYPTAISYCRRTQRLFVSYAERSQLSPASLLRIFKVSWC